MTMKMMIGLDLHTLDGSLQMAHQLRKKKEALEKKKKASARARSRSATSKTMKASYLHSASETYNGSISEECSIQEKTATVTSVISPRVPKKKAVSVSSASTSTAPPTSAVPPPTISTTETFMFKHSMAVDRTWEQIKTCVPDYEAIFGEQVVLNMIELDPQARQAMGIVSLRTRSNRLDQIQEIILLMIDLVVMFFGPNVDDFQQELLELGRRCREEGIPCFLLPTAVSQAVRFTLSTVAGTTNPNLHINNDDLEAWKVVLELFCAQKMAQVTTPHENNHHQ